MVATRRGTVILPPVEPEAVVGTQVSAERSTSAPQRQTRGIKAEPSHVNQSESFNLRSKRHAQHLSRKEVTSEGEVSEAESTCSTHSVLQTPSISRTTRSRQNVPSSQADSVLKNQNKKSVLTSVAITDSHEEADVSEAESNCSVTEVRRTISRPTRSSQRKSKLPKSLASECQPEEVSDSESCSSTLSAGQLNRVTRGRISKAQTDVVRQSHDCNRESVLQSLTKNKADDVSDAESWCSGIATGRNVGRLTRNSLARSQTETENHPMVLSDSGFIEKLASDTEKASVESSRVLRSLRSRQPSQTDSESQFKSQAESLSCDLKDSITTLKVTEKRSIIVATPNNQRLVCDQAKPGSPEELFSQASEVVKDKCAIQNELEEAIPLQAELVDAKRSTRKQKDSLKKGSKPVVHPQRIVEEIIIDDDDDCEITEVIAAVGTTTCPASVVIRNSIQLNPTDEHITELRKDIGSALFLASDTEIEISDTDSEDVYVVENEKKVPSEESFPSGNDLFVIDKAPGLSTSKKYYIEKEKTNVESKGVELEEVESIHDETDDGDFIDEDESEALLQRTQAGLSLSTAIDPGLNIKDLGGLYIDLEAGQQIQRPSTLKAKEKKKNEEVLKHSIITPDFEKKDSESTQQLKKKRKEERAKTTGDGWFGMRAPELTDELKNDLKALKMRSAIDPKRFYKKNDREGFPKYFQVGTVVDNAVDFYHSRIPKNQRKRTIVEELLADSEFRRYNKKKYQEIITEKMAHNAGKKNRIKKKFKT